MLKMISRLVRDEEGQGLAEYALILVLIAVAAIVAVRTLGTRISDIFGEVNTGLQPTS
jgi:pilus assembly protein Flp/PilA